MKILFLDIDGVVNCQSTTQRHRGFIGIDPYMALLVGRITLAVPDLKVVLSSSWRLGSDGGIEEIETQVVQLFDKTPRPFVVEGDRWSTRGEEIQKWLNDHNSIDDEITHYAILDDDPNMLSSQLPNYFQTQWLVGLTEEIANKVIEHLNK